jgi:hypothetical protein
MKRRALILVVVLGVAAVPVASAAAAAADQPVTQVDNNTVVGPTGETVSHGLGAVAW